MKILVFDKYLGYQVGGAQNSLHTLLKNLKGDFKFLGCDVNKSFSAQKYKLSEWEVERIQIKEFPKFPYFEYWLNRRRVKKFIKNQKADLLIAQGLWGAIAINAFSGKRIYYIRDEYHLNKIKIYQRGFKAILKVLYILFQLPFILVLFQDNKKAIKNSTIAMANSKFIANEIKKIFKRDCEMVYSVIDVRKLCQSYKFNPEKKKFLALVGSEIIKGSGVVKKIAQIMPDHKFLIIGRSFKEKMEEGNILYEPWQVDPIFIYEKTKILLAPSLWDDSRPRVLIESAALGIPCIGSNRGGIPEALGKDFIIEDVWDIEKWKEKILEIENNYEKVSEKLRERQKEFDFMRQVEHFKKVVKEKLNFDL